MPDLRATPCRLVGGSCVPWRIFCALRALRGNAISGLHCRRAPEGDWPGQGRLQIR
uniref:Uncharacterized protein n=1 Tax=uncultured marine virus TaxID=186617 RepID=A0A0F7L491_9VIRU|nr:hypothetical protein [uncultured marine virus]